HPLEVCAVAVPIGDRVLERLQGRDRGEDDEDDQGGQGEQVDRQGRGGRRTAPPPTGARGAPTAARGARRGPGGRGMGGGAPRGGTTGDRWSRRERTVRRQGRPAES